MKKRSRDGHDETPLLIQKRGGGGTPARNRLYREKRDSQHTLVGRKKKDNGRKVDGTADQEKGKKRSAVEGKALPPFLFWDILSGSYHPVEERQFQRLKKQQPKKEKGQFILRMDVEA